VKLHDTLIGYQKLRKYAMLTLYEKLFLLVLDEEKGNLISFTRKSFAYSVAGAILAELALAGKLGVGEKLRLVAQDGEGTGDPILDDALEQIRASDKLHKPSYWVSAISAEPKKLRYTIGEQLAGKHVLTQDEKRFFRQEPATESDAVPSKFQLKHELRSLVLSNGARDLRNIALVKMLAAGGLLYLCFTLDEMDAAEQIIHTQLLTAALENPTMELVEEIGQAVTNVREDEME
jgi:hypothetical protein